MILLTLRESHDIEGRTMYDVGGRSMTFGGRSMTLSRKIYDIEGRSMTLREDLRHWEKIYDIKGRTMTLGEDP